MRNTTIMKTTQTIQKGFGLFELIISLGIIGTLIAGVLFYQTRTEAAQTRSSVVTALTSISSEIRSTFGAATNGDYQAVTNQNLNNSGIVVPPFTGNGANITTPWGGALTTAGNNGFFAIQIPAPDATTCQAIISRLSQGAERIVVHNAAITFGGTGTTTATVLLPGTVDQTIKANGSATYSAANAATACANTPVIGIAFR